MADDNKKDISIDIAINPYGECKGDAAPAWFAARQKLSGIIQEIKVKRTMKLDARKWKKKDIESGVYAIAKYDLALFATALGSMEKNIDKAFSANKANAKTKRDAKFYRNTKDDTKEEAAAISDAEKRVTSLWKKVSKSIEDKVSLALDEVESDKGDNKKALAVGKQALKVFDRIETKQMFADPIQRALNALKHLSLQIGKAKQGEDTDDYFKAALRELRDIESDYDLVAKSTSKVAKMFVTLGEKLSKDKNADGEIQKFGESLVKGSMKSNLETLSKNIKDLGKDLDMLVNFIAKGDHDAKTIAAKAGKFKSDHEKKKGSANAITAEMRKLSTEFGKIEKKLK